MSSTTKGQLIKITSAHPIGHITLAHASGGVSAYLTVSLGGWLYQNLHHYDSYLVSLA